MILRLFAGIGIIAIIAGIVALCHRTVTQDDFPVPPEPPEDLRDRARDRLDDLDRNGPRPA